MKRWVLLTIGLAFLLATFAPRGDSVDLKDAVGVWLLDEKSGEVAHDSSGNGNDGTLQNGGNWVKGKFGNALELNGTNQFVEVPDSDSLDLEDEVTMICWFWWEGSGDGWQTFFSKGPASGTNENWAHFINTAGYTHFILNAGGTRSNLDSPGNSFDANKWYHAASTYDGSMRRIYIDGEEVANGALNGKLVPNNNYLGLVFREASTHYWKGMLDDMAVFKRALSEEEVVEIMEDGLSAGMAVSPKDKLTLTWGEIKVVPCQ